MKKLFYLFCVVIIAGSIFLFRSLNLKHHLDEETADVQEITTNTNEVSNEATDERQIYRMLDFDRRLILNVGKQDPEICSIFCLAYARAILDHDYKADPYDYYDGDGAVWRWAGFQDIASSDPLDTVLKRAYDEINDGRPAIFFVSGDYAYTTTDSPQIRSAWQHYVLLIGYKADADYNHLKASDFYAADPTAGYKTNDENDIPWIVLTDEAPETVQGEFALYAYREDNKHVSVVEAYADTVRWDADRSEEIYPEYSND